MRVNEQEERKGKREYTSERSEIILQQVSRDAPVALLVKRREGLLDFAQTLREYKKKKRREEVEGE